MQKALIAHVGLNKVLISQATRRSESKQCADVTSDSQAGLAPCDKMKVHLPLNVKQQIVGRYDLGFQQPGAIDFNAEVANLRWLTKVMKSGNQCVAQVRFPASWALAL